jgi:dCMP deaminase
MAESIPNSTLQILTRKRSLDMTDKAQIAAGLSKIFAHRESFIVVALTGRTGSGCSTVAKLLSTKQFGDIPFPSIPTPPKNHEDRKDRIVLNWIENHWYPFQIIQVGQIILLLTLAKSQSDIFDYISNIAPMVDASKLKALFSEFHETNCNVLNTLNSLRAASDEDVNEACNYILNQLPIISASTKEDLNTSENNGHTRIFQKLGDNVRRSGNPLSDSINPDGLLVLPGVIAQIIKLFRLKNRHDGITNNYFVIDALRHPFEIRYLRERISPFYAIAVTTDEKSRRARLTESNFRIDEIEELDAKEYPSEAKDTTVEPQSGYSAFVSQNIQACLGISDVYIRNNGGVKGKRPHELARQLCRYFALMQHPGLVTPTSIERCMQVAFSAKLNSGCISRQVGAVVTDAEYSIKAMGWNDAPRGQVPCLLRNTSHVQNQKDSTAYSEFEMNNAAFQEYLSNSKLGRVCKEHINGRNNTFCFKTMYNGIKKDRNQVHTRSLHAEENAFLQIARYGGQGLVGGCLFTTASPCELCAKKAFQLGIRKIYFIDPYPGITREHVLASGQGRPELFLFMGAIGNAYHGLYQPVMSYKDELDCFI